MKLVFFFFCCFVAGGLAAKLTHLDYEWEAWKAKHGKLYYDGHEEEIRRSVWEKNLLFVDEHNKLEREGKRSFTVEMNKFADLNAAEFAKYFLGFASKPRSVNGSSCRDSNIYVNDQNYGSLPDAVDWRKKGYVTPIKNQGQCGSCWAFSATGSLEGQHFKTAGKLVSLSEQNLMDCSWDEGDMGCNGGLMDNAFEYVLENGGIDTEESYPYRAEDGSCSFSKRGVGATITGCADVTPSGDEHALQKAVAHVGPISVAIDASQESFQLYAGGVYDDPDCSSTLLDHGVLAVGYGADKKGQDYWTVKNSWGEDWGMDGYILMGRNFNNLCGIATQASYPVV